MTLADATNIAEIISAVAVVVTLLYLAVQVRHSKEALDANTKAIRGQVISDATRNVHDHMHMILQGHDVVAALMNWASEHELSPEDAILMDSLWTAVSWPGKTSIFSGSKGCLKTRFFGQCIM